MKISALHSSAGPSPAEVGDLESTQLWPNLQAAMGSIARIKGTLEFVNSKLSTLEAEALGKSTTASSQMGGMEKKTEGVLSLVRMLMEERERESNRGKLAALEASIADVRASVQDSTLNGPVGLDRVGASAALEGRIARLELTLVQVKASIGGEVVKIGQDTFHSPLEVESWVIKYVGESGILEGWIDVVSMLELLADLSVIAI